MTNLINVLKEAAGNSKYGQAVVAEFEANPCDDDKKYGQTIKDRLDDRIGIIRGWEAKFQAEGKLAEAGAEADKLAVLEAMKSAIK
jgi:hypothetical protein